MNKPVWKLNIINQFQEYLKFLVIKNGLSVEGAVVLARRSFRRREFFTRSGQYGRIKKLAYKQCKL